ncbi:electron transfer flavoprotein subunit alpha/FixB family protein [Synergistes jonesii]|uniref:Electron transfer flavoprotein subunit alpha n=1 Tax=Synergistes jonesii TaxID=2754 RepID=A0A073ISA7_9BACT|nr:electron transfer flavoprotein subunit alpha/FixB family protein [Synergistes jonesii]KEJ92361.1 electron transfer flavoprotein subunit alpha [Synergistes jonesii]OFB62804.1 electron transfer flavoprotein subunit alpha [Synergistes jonesii]OFB63511.1 electron transfer flavoprotein subunit alpha [Synergistes jonesii]OFB65446.1 electron transfer flavoprotein subunit alpha [Synergistes jonesii]OFB67749.1 electron transfer flavoprotein subunit alpha [Synergistes jonesii]
MSAEVWTLAEVRGGKIHPVSRELLAWGKELADALGAPLASVVVGSGIKEQSASLAAYGADKVYVADAPEFENFKADITSATLAEMIEKYKPSILIASATTQGRTVMPMLSSRIGCGLTADCTELAIDRESKRLIQTRPAIGGNVMADIKTKGRDPQMCTVRPKSKRPLSPDASRECETIEFAPKKELLESLVKFIKFEAEKSVGLPLQEAEIIVSGGKGMKNAKNFARLEELARLLGGSVGASRMAVDLGWAPYSAQVGLSGKSVTPRLYLAFGISGAVQHIAGMSGAETIVAVNQDPEAPIFRVADLAVQGDAMEMLGGLIEAVKKYKGLR